MSLIPYVPDEFVALAVGAVVLYFVGVQGIRAAVRRESKVNVIEQLVRELGFKNMKVGDLNSKALDDIGFLRLVALLREMKALGAAPQFGQPRGLQQLQGLTEYLNQLKAAAQATQPPQSTPPPAPTPQTQVDRP